MWPRSWNGTIIERSPVRSRCRFWNFAHFARLSETGRSGGCWMLRRQRCQCVQRLWKALHRDDSKPVRILPRGACVRPRRDEEDVHTRLARADRLLLDGANRQHAAVELELARCGDLVAAVDVVPELLRQVEREGEPGRGAADAAGVDANLDRELAGRAADLVDENPDRGLALVVGAGDRPDRRRGD